MPVNTSPETSSESDWTDVRSPESHSSSHPQLSNEQPLGDDTERLVDELFEAYKGKIEFVRNYPDATREMRQQCVETATKELMEEIQKLPDLDKAINRISRLLETTEHLRQAATAPHQPIPARPSETVQDESREPAEEPTASAPQPIIEQGQEESPTNDVPEQGLRTLFDIDDDGKTIFDPEVLNDICEQIGNLPVAIVSTAGKFRQGKTMGNNFLLCGLKKGECKFEPNEFIGGRDGIRFQNGYERHTKGIQVWPEVFFRNDKDGNRIAVVLMDTQGTFDTSSDIADSAVIFAISLLMSSKKIFNTKTQIDASDLDALNVFINFSRRNEEKVGQHFMIMVRDALQDGLNPEYLENLKTSSRRAPKLHDMVNGAFDAFELVECYMVPRPSDLVLRATSEIRASDCGDEFLKSLSGAANHILSNLVPKTFMGTPLNGETLKKFVENLVEHVQEARQNDIGSAFEATTQLYLEKARSAGNDIFTTQYEQYVRDHDYMPVRPQKYDDDLTSIRSLALQAFESCTRFGTPAHKQKQYEEYSKVLEERCIEKSLNNKERYRERKLADAVNNGFLVYEKGMKPDIVETLLGKDKDEFIMQKHEKCKREALDYFEAESADVEEEQELIAKKRTLLTEMIENRCTDLREENASRQIQESVHKFIEDEGEEYANKLRQETGNVRTESDIDRTIADRRQKSVEEFPAAKKRFLDDIKNKFPSVDVSVLDKILDNFKQSRLEDLVARADDEFTIKMRQHVKISKLTNKITELGDKHKEKEKKAQEMHAQLNGTIKDVKKQLREEKDRRQAAEAEGRNQMQPLMMMMQQMKEAETRQMEQMRIERSEREERERRREEELARQRQLEREEMRRQREEDRNRAEERERRREEAEEWRRREQEIKDAAAEKLRQAEERRREEQRREEERRKKEQEQKGCSIM